MQGGHIVHGNVTDDQRLDAKGVGMPLQTLAEAKQNICDHSKHDMIVKKPLRIPSLSPIWLRLLIFF